MSKVYRNLLNTVKLGDFTFHHVVLVLFTLIGALAAGFSSFLYKSNISPLFIGGMVLVLIILLLWLKKPKLALCSTLFIIFLADGLLPANIQSVLNRGMTVATFVIWFFYTIRRSRRIMLTGSAIFMLLFLIWSATTLFWTSSVGTGLARLQTYFLRFLLFLLLVPNLIYSEKDLSLLMRTLALSGWLLAFVSIVQVVKMGYAAGSRLDVLGENENALGTKLLIYLIGVLWLALHDPYRHKTIYKLLSYVYLVLLIFITAMSGSRGSAISLGVTLTLLLFWKQTRRWGLLGLLIILIGLMLAPIAFTTLLDRFAATANDTTLSGREGIWQATLKLIQLHPWTGVGIGNASREIIPFVRVLQSVGGRISVAIHNPILAILAETGIIGLLLYLSIAGSAIWIFVKRYFQNIKFQSLSQYFPLVVAIFIGYMFSWIKSGGAEFDHSYFLMLSLFLIPSCPDTQYE